jgi:hypothetical protein
VTARRAAARLAESLVELGAALGQPIRARWSRRAGGDPLARSRSTPSDARGRRRRIDR